uniref:HTH luxR-type domain-containing protein n=1 Tax=Thermosporothrix sp. COM3 TaxID=2490863 RepID=A0A455SDH1_9CHLR|nr:hypothetical protein KTC_12440 [Thermosporothrix sp. COM3]
MPRQTAFKLLWEPARERYVVDIAVDIAINIAGDMTVPCQQIEVESQDWFQWLEYVPSFSFQDRRGYTCTLRKERVQRGGAYWYAYRRQQRKMVKRYLGHSKNLTVARLEQVAEQLNIPTETPELTAEHVQELLRQGRLHQAAALLRRLLEGAEAEKSRLLLAQSEIAYEWNDLSAARRALEEGIACGRPEEQLDGYVLLARLALAEGQMQEAEQALQQAEALAQQLHAASLARVAGMRALLALKQEQREQMLLWAQERQADENTSLFESLVLARVLLAQGRIADATSLLKQLAVHQEARNGSLVEIRMLQALVAHAQTRNEEAVSLLMQALSQAASEGYMRLFVDEGRVMQELLLRVREQHGRKPASLLHYLDRLLAAFPPAPHQASTHESLSKRELEVLALLAQGCSNQEIAGRLVVAVSTVKSHIKHLFAKLGVQRRSQAVKKAKAAGLLDA